MPDEPATHTCAQCTRVIERGLTHCFNHAPTDTGNTTHRSAYVGRTAMTQQEQDALRRLDARLPIPRHP